MAVTPDAILWLLDELEANRRSRRSAWSTLQRLRKFLEAHGARISIPGERTFDSEGEAIESGLKRTIEGRETVMRGLIRAVYRFRDATLVAEKKDDFGRNGHSLSAQPIASNGSCGSSFIFCMLMGDLLSVLVERVFSLRQTKKY